ncbi:hypothetical protein [Paenibacillus sp. J2TS4]|uniref:hypothetical protein n=1 Tax=Paenibacillus sp. J2TS4 TaxID=2807194 RepID=UPI001B1EE552|nr:hypothetical protein [Paenibacillus sp. J2TS4]GIP36185.1 hypothetical protein J2TS4_53950 [Paenibacillus sp. J2TS4]
MKKKERLEKAVTDSLLEGELNKGEPDKMAVERLPSKYEIRQTVKLDPIVEETTVIRTMAEEVDDRYDEYMKRSERGTPSDTNK